jgi:hypothetical protein
MAVFVEPTDSGDPRDPNSARNAPLNSPLTNLPWIRFHTDLDYLEVAAAGTVTVSHAAIDAASAPDNALVAFAVSVPGDRHTLVSHDLPYIPFALVAAGTNCIWPGMPVQADGLGAARYASVICTSTGIDLVTTATAGTNALPAEDFEYSYLIFKRPPTAEGKVLFDFDPTTGIVTIARGKWASNRRYLMVAEDGSPQGMALGRTIDLKGGVARAWRPDGTTVDLYPTDFALFLSLVANGIEFEPIAGATYDYGGGYAGPVSVEVQAP